MSLKEYTESSEYEVLTGDGWKEFTGVKRSKTDKIIKLTFGSEELKCTLDHLVQIDSGEFVEAKDLVIGQVMSTSAVLTNSEIYDKDEFVYDLLNVEDVASYVTGPVISHNCAFVERWDEFSASVMPTLSSGKETRMIFTSTPCGLNHFFHYVDGAKNDTNGFSFLEVPWTSVPGRDEKWKEEILGTINHDLQKFETEYACVDYNTKVTISDDIRTIDIAVGELYYLMDVSSKDVKYNKDLTIEELFMSKPGVIYKLTRTDGLSYIGISCQFDKRLLAHKQSSRFTSGILDVEILFEGTYEECFKLEEFFIEKYDTFNNGLNATHSGKGYGPHTKSGWITVGDKHTDTTKEKMRDNHWSKTGVYSPKGQTCSDEARKKMSAARKGKLLYTPKFDKPFKEKVRADYNNITVTIDDVLKYCAAKYKNLVTPDNFYNGIKLKSGHDLTEHRIKMFKLADQYHGVLTKAHLHNIIEGKTLD